MKSLIIGKHLAAEIITQIWLSYLEEPIKYKNWPVQCNDINKYLIEFDLATIINIPTIKDELIELYKVISKKIAILYYQDKNLKISSYEGNYLARANYELLIKNYEKLFNIALGSYKKKFRN